MTRGSISFRKNRAGPCQVMRGTSFLSTESPTPDGQMLLGISKGNTVSREHLE